MHHRRLNNKDLAMIEERIEKKLSSSKGKYLLMGGRLVLINSVLSSLPMFMLSFFKILKGIIEKIDYFRSRFFWKNNSKKKEVQAHQMEYGVSTQGLRGAWNSESRNPKPMLIKQMAFQTY
jgi:hypothetical protein